MRLATSAARVTSANSRASCQIQLKAADSRWSEQRLQPRSAAHAVRDGETSLARRYAARAVLDSALPVVPAIELALAPASFFRELGCGARLVVSAVAGFLSVLCILRMPLAGPKDGR